MNIKTEDIIPTGKRLLIQPDEKATETEGGIILAGDEKNTAPVKGVIIRAGKDSEHHEGQTVLFRRYAIDELKIQDGIEEQIVYFLEDSDILGTVSSEVEVELSREIKYPKIAEKKAIEEQQKNADKENENIIEETSNGKQDDEKGGK